MSDNDVLFWRMLALFQCLPELQPAQIMTWLTREQDEALTPARLAAYTQRQLEAFFPAEDVLMSPGRWSRIKSCLRGELPFHLRVQNSSQRKPQLLVAFCSQDGLVINGHFGQGRLFFIYGFDDEGYWLHSLRRYPSAPQEQEPNEVRAKLLGDCQLLFCEAIGGPAAARLIRHNIHPMKVSSGLAISTQCDNINKLLAGQLPPWLAKRLNRTNPLESRVF
ncbi:NifB/NifX family molybdenum-iron cluster-binding protein [Pantoea sp. At-9b]|uniref:NifB/NifX family molybdenum-iron cluster-binding protein n=1 Tax=Pantoea sp. (strain At-9b) TaxID=592316 RepID=UPI0001B400B8|nr:NifB/NifX family molybdenum-iron cluster-binding protein [Pantoea sp. At-9b]ACU32750.1 dinitrogenase iron-molybdenum cofactor biosynthesis protein [Pantoea sp. At-9b]ADU72685.1 Dinitrogenase iron-molybdenum cofactor biosynthesis protein [Pantoea sp. At-9b]